MSIKNKLNAFYDKVISDLENNKVTDYTIEIADKYNELVKKNTKFHCRRLFAVSSNCRTQDKGMYSI